MCGHHAAVGQRAGTHRDINAFLDKINAAIIKHQAKLQPGMGRHECGKARDYVEPGKSDGRANAQTAAKCRTCNARCRLCLFGSVQRRLGSFVKDTASVSEYRRPRRPGEQAHAKPALQLRHGLRNSGLPLSKDPGGCGAALKLVANTLFGIQVTAMAELLGRMSALGLDSAQAVELLGETPVLSMAAKSAAGLMLAGKTDPMFPVDLVAKDFGYAIAGDMPVAAAALRVFARAQADGLGDRNLTAVSALYR
jgi:hypothetical protein